MEKLELRAGKTLRMRKPKKTDFTAAKQDKFFATLAATCNAAAAARAARISKQTANRHRRKYAAFRARWAEAVREAYANLELMMLKRMMDGTVKTVTKHDGSTETVHEYPNALALQLLRLHRGEAAEAAIEHNPADVDEARERIIRRIARLRKQRAEERAGDEAA